MTKAKKGLRCQVCTGCGLCPGVGSTGQALNRVHVLTDEFQNTQTKQTSCAPPDTFLAAIDIGTTTVAMLLYDGVGKVLDRYVTVNPQTEYGADVLSRITAANKGAADRMQSLIRDVTEKGLVRFREKLPAGASLFAVVAANTTMSHLFMGWDVNGLGQAPFTVSHRETARTMIAGVPCLLFPPVSAFVGGDITAGIYALDLVQKEEITLLVDLGTNGEIVLGNCRKCLACATAAGPAFEGGASKGIWGADMVSFLAALRRENLLDETGLLAEPWFETGIRVGNVRVTKEAVRAVQMAKAAIAAGIDILLERYGITADRVDRVILAGGFGYYLNPSDAAEIGLIPGKLAKKAFAGGNTALAGARKAGRQMTVPDSACAQGQASCASPCEEEGQEAFAACAQALERIAATVECINLAEDTQFNDCYLKHFSLTHT